MRASVLSRCLIAFALLLLLSVLSVAVMIPLLLASDAGSSLAASMSSLYGGIEKQLDDSGLSFEDAAARIAQEGDIALSADLLYLSVLFTDTEGNILSSVANDAAVRETVSENVLSLSGHNAPPRRISLFPDSAEKYTAAVFPYIRKTRDDPPILGYVILYTPFEQYRQTISRVILPFIAAVVTVLVIAFIVLFFIGRQLKKAAEASENAKRMFISDVSHDLRTPMTKIKGFIDAILDGAVPKEKQNYYLGIVSEEVSRLSRLVGTLLDISRLGSGKPSIAPESFDICEIVRLIAISFEDKITAKRIAFSLDSDEYGAYVFADRDAIYQVLYNLIDNAVKFTDDDGTLKVSVRPDPQNHQYTVTVFNTGIGIREEEKEKVFDRFFRADMTKTFDKTGVGLGLFIVKTKLDLHGAQIDVRSEYGKNCSFVFSLPFGEKPEKKRGAPQ